MSEEFEIDGDPEFGFDDPDEFELDIDDVGDGEGAEEEGEDGSE